MKCNIDKTDRINRIVIGVILIFAALIELGKAFFIIAGVILIIEGIVGWCSIPGFVEKFKRRKNSE